MQTFTRIIRSIHPSGIIPYGENNWWGKTSVNSLQNHVWQNKIWQICRWASLNNNIATGACACVTMFVVQDVASYSYKP